jgi:hypothetical protein
MCRSQKATVHQNRWQAYCGGMTDVRTYVFLYREMWSVVFFSGEKRAHHVTNNTLYYMTDVRPKYEKRN